MNMIIHDFCCDMRLVLSLAAPSDFGTPWPAASMMTMPPKSPVSPHWQWQLIPARPPSCSKNIQEYGTIRWKSMTPEATWKHELWPWWTLKHDVKVPNVLSGAYRQCPQTPYRYHPMPGYGRNSSWSPLVMPKKTHFYKLPTSECHDVTTFNPEIPTMITEAKILLQTADFPVSSQASQRMLWRSALKHDDIQETTQIHSAWSHNVNTALICTLSFLAFLVSSICPKALQTPVTVLTESQRTETQSTSEIFFRNRADPMKILLRPSISFNHV